MKKLNAQVNQPRKNNALTHQLCHIDQVGKKCKPTTYQIQIVLQCVGRVYGPSDASQASSKHEHSSLFPRQVLRPPVISPIHEAIAHI